MVFPFGRLLVCAIVGVNVGTVVDVAVVTLVGMPVGVFDGGSEVGELAIPTTRLPPPLFTCKPIITPPITRAMTRSMPMKSSKGCKLARDGRRDPG